MKEYMKTHTNKNRSMSVRTVVCIIMMMALILTGAAPSFADAQNTDSGSGSIKLKASTDINWDDAPEISGTSAIMIDAGSGAILYEKNAYEQRDPASITKIITALIALENLDMNEEVTAYNEPDPEGTNIALKVGETLTAEQMINATLIASANDAADALAMHMGGSWEGFAEMMNERAAQCGAKDTEFSNPSGLTPAGQRHVTTAYDIAMIAREAMKNEQFREIVAKKQYTIPETDMSSERNIKSTNMCLVGDSKTAEVNGKERPLKYEGTTGVKTGFTEDAGYCFCGAAKKKDTELIVVTLNAEKSAQRFTDTIALRDYGFSKYKTYKAAEAGQQVVELRIWQGAKSRVPAAVAEDMDITLDKGTKTDTVTTEVLKAEKKLKAPVEKGDSIGTLVAYNEDGDVIAASDLVALESVEKGGPLSYIGIADEHKTLFIVTQVILLILIFVLFVAVKRSQRKKRQRMKAKRAREARRREWERQRDMFNR